MVAKGEQKPPWSICSARASPVALVASWSINPPRGLLLSGQKHQVPEGLLLVLSQNDGATPGEDAFSYLAEAEECCFWGPLSESSVFRLLSALLSLA